MSHNPILILLFELGWHTVRKSRIVSKNSIFKIHNCVFEFLSRKTSFLWIFLNTWFAWIIWIFAPKIVILCKYRINNNWKLLNFGCENSKSNRNQRIIITLIDWFLARKIKFTFFLKIEFLDTIWDFLIVWKCIAGLQILPYGIFKRKRRRRGHIEPSPIPTASEMLLAFSANLIWRFSS